MTLIRPVTIENTTQRRVINLWCLEPWGATVICPLVPPVLPKLSETKVSQNAVFWLRSAAQNIHGLQIAMNNPLLVHNRLFQEMIFVKI